MNDFLTFAEVAEQLKCTLKKIRTLVIENKTLRATRVTPNGVVLDSCGPEGHVPYDLGFDCHLDGNGEITCDVYGGDSTGQTVLLKTLDVGALRVARKDLENFCTAYPHQAAPGSTLEAPESTEQRQDCRLTECEAAGGGSARLWTSQRVAEARKLRNELERSGVKDFAKQTAARFNVTPTRLRAVLGKEPSKPGGATYEECVRLER